MILSDQLLKQRLNAVNNPIEISGVQAEDIQPNSIDLRLGYIVWRLRHDLPGDYVYDLRDPSCEAAFEPWIIPHTGLVIESGEFLLGATEARIHVPRDLTATLEGLSSIGRTGLNIQNAGRVDSLWDGDLTLELLNTLKRRMRIYGGMRIAQIVFSEVAGQVLMGYGDFRRKSKYQDSVGPVLSKEYANHVAT